jgi:hypothetical protein
MISLGGIKFDCVDVICIIARKMPGNGSGKRSRKSYKHDDYDCCHHVSMLVSGFLITGHIHPL